MAKRITKIHQFLMRAVITITTLTLALSLSLIVQQLSGNISTELESFYYAPPAGLAVILAFLSIPRLQFDAVTAPTKPTHVLAQIAVWLFGSPLIAWTVFMAFQTPLAVWLLPVKGLFIAIGCFAIYSLLAILGCLRAIWPTVDEGTNEDANALRKAHNTSRIIAAVLAFAISCIILGSVLILRNPTSPSTPLRAITMLVCAVLLVWPWFGVKSITQPARLLDIAPQVVIAITTIHIVERTTRALLFHSQLFDSSTAIDLLYPRLENLLMLPFIVFGLTGVALALPHRRQGNESIVDVFE